MTFDLNIKYHNTVQISFIGLVFSEWHTKDPTGECIIIISITIYSNYPEKCHMTDHHLKKKCIYHICH